MALLVSLNKINQKLGKKYSLMVMKNSIDFLSLILENFNCIEYYLRQKE
jgi:hypothetical protein